ncbi:hypothetical protein RUM44_009527 [Polyplax serrata]|uniref:Uncharacterized protein n=1 Tax=Polyplax serrata TaxID=468196 RepID=A0ABR1ASY4_POLSC
MIVFCIRYEDQLAVDESGAYLAAHPAPAASPPLWVIIGFPRFVDVNVKLVSPEKRRVAVTEPQQKSDQAVEEGEAVPGRNNQLKLA